MMIERLFPLQFFKKSPFYGDCGQMRYCIRKKEEELEVCIFPGPYAMEHTPEEKKQYFTFPFNDEGLEAARECLNREYAAKDWEREKLPW